MKRTIYLLFLGSAVVFGPLACSSRPEEDAALQKKDQPQAKTSSDKAPEPSNGTTQEVKAVVEGNNELAFDLYSRLSKKEKGNIIFSPYSISNALAMTYAGARGETAEQMAKVLHFPLGQDRLHEAFGSLIGQLEEGKKDRPFHLYVANALWVQEKFPLEEDFLRINRKNYGAGLKEVNFAHRPEEARQTINTWVAKQTQDKIKELLLSEDVSPLTRLYLTNAVYFKATWQRPFPKENTKDEHFEVAPDVKPLVPMMHHEEKYFRYFEDESFQWLELPYVGRRLAMVVLLPRKKDQLTELEKSLTAPVIQKGLSHLSLGRGSVALPRFKATLRLRIEDDLIKMGMPLAFASGADFSGITRARDLHISRVVHKAFIDVDESGTEAAAASGVGMPFSRPIPFSFQADHPFLFFIYDQTTGSILFLGRVSDPR